MSQGHMSGLIKNAAIMANLKYKNRRLTNYSLRVNCFHTQVNIKWTYCSVYTVQEGGEPLGYFSMVLIIKCFPNMD